MKRKLSPFLFLAFALVSSNADSQEISPEPSSIETVATTFTSDEGFVFDAKIVVPCREDRNGYGVLMIGGGYANDLDWTSPGFVEYQGRKTQISINGMSHADAPLIATSLADDGFVVMHWTTIRRGDRKRDLWPNEATVYPIEDLLRFSKSALAEFRGRRLFEDDKVILLGHSLGAVRAANLASADEQVDALVLLAAAQLTRTSSSDRGQNKNRNITVDVIRSIDTDGDAACSEMEYSAWTRKPANQQHPLVNQSFEQLDFHPDRQLVDWEIAAGFARSNRSADDFKESPALDASGLQWTEDILIKKKIDTLILYGSLDNAQSHHAPIISDLIKTRRLDHVHLKVLPGVGHQLGPEVDDLVGPISQESRKVIVDWLKNRTSAGSHSR